MGLFIGVFRKSFISLLVVLLASTLSHADPSSLIASPVSSSSNLQQSALPAILQVFQSVSSPLPEQREELFQMELGSLEYAQESGLKLDTEQYKKKRVLVYFWSIYCRGCIEPVKELETLRSVLKDSGIEVVTVHLFESDRVRLVERLAQLSLGLPVLFGPSEVRDMFSVRVLPTALMFDEDHALVARLEGGFEKEGLSVRVTREEEQIATASAK